MKNIYYASIVNKGIYPTNTRGRFISYIDIHHLEYLKENNLEVAIKSITYDDKTTLTISKNDITPKIVIREKIDYITYYNFTENIPKTSLRQPSESTLNLTKSMDYVVVLIGNKY